jgi:hypothetical protein
MDNSDKTIPYNPSITELEKIRLLGLKYKSFDTELFGSETSPLPNDGVAILKAEPTQKNEDRRAS